MRHGRRVAESATPSVVSRSRPASTCAGLTAAWLDIVSFGGRLKIAAPRTCLSAPLALRGRTTYTDVGHRHDRRLQKVLTQVAARHSRRCINVDAKEPGGISARCARLSDARGVDLGAAGGERLSVQPSAALPITESARGSLGPRARGGRPREPLQAVCPHSSPAVAGLAVSLEHSRSVTRPQRGAHTLRRL